MKRLVALLQTVGPTAAPANLATLAFAQAFRRVTGAPFDLLVAGGLEAGDFAQAYTTFGAEHVILVFSPELSHALPQTIAEICVGRFGRETGASLAGPATEFGNEALACAAGLLGLPMLSAVSAIEEIDGKAAFRVPCGHRREQIVRIDLGRAVFSVAPTAFGAPERMQQQSKVEQMPAVLTGVFFKGIKLRKRGNPRAKPTNLQTARVVVAGGRALNDAESFQQLIGGLAKKLAAAAGATGAAVQAGIAPSDLLVGQTGQTVSPDLYIAAGISGSDQHTGGMQGSRVVVAINSNPNATIFSMADYGLFADVHQALPELIEKL